MKLQEQFGIASKNNSKIKEAYLKLDAYKTSLNIDTVYKNG